MQFRFGCKNCKSKTENKQIESLHYLKSNNFVSRECVLRLTALIFKLWPLEKVIYCVKSDSFENKKQKMTISLFRNDLFRKNFPVFVPIQRSNNVFGLAKMFESRFIYVSYLIN